MMSRIPTFTGYKSLFFACIPVPLVKCTPYIYMKKVMQKTDASHGINYFTLSKKVPQNILGK